MSIKERILTIRLLDLIRANPEYAKTLGLEVTVKKHVQKNNL